MFSALEVFGHLKQMNGIYFWGEETLDRILNFFMILIPDQHNIFIFVLVSHSR